MNPSPAARRRALLAIAFVIYAPRMLALEAVSNLGESGSGIGWAVDATQWVAASFQTGPDAMTLDSVDLLVQGTEAGDFTVSLAANNDQILTGVPGVALTALSGPDPGVEALYNYVPTLPTMLAANTIYWVVVSSALTDLAGYGWIYSASTAEAGLPGWLIGDDPAFSEDAGATWLIYGVDELETPKFRVNVAAVPEPSTWSAGGLVALLAAVGWQRGRHARARQG